MKLKLDLHTHCLEATRFARPSVEVVEKIVSEVRAKGLDGIGITDHYDLEYAYQVMEIVKDHFDSSILIIPGQEVDRVYQHVIELYPRRDLVFRFVAHPGYPSYRWPDHLDGIQGVEIENGNWGVSQTLVRQVAEERDLLMLSNSDAHTLQNIGRYYNEIDLDEIISRAEKVKEPPP